MIDPRLQAYCEAHTTPEGKILKDIDRDTHAHVLMPRMLSGHLQGRFLAMVSHMIEPRCVLEIGTYTGYSALCLAEGLAAGGKVITLDKNEELETRVRTAFAEAGMEACIDYRIGDARAIIPTLPEVFDLVFIDADKESYSLYFDLVIEKVTSGGYLIADNVLWSGKVVESKPDKDTRALLEFNQKIKEDQRVENILLPVRDGLMVMRKK
ncbi:MAG: O-methyltransferase [Cyclobacteriaceae bacterium]|jgi:predicted O-methyltransferase YrrM|nr:O-methyltransferase [Cyclobacteriaceae bacterium]